MRLITSQISSQGREGDWRDDIVILDDIALTRVKSLHVSRGIRASLGGPACHQLGRSNPRETKGRRARGRSFSGTRAEMIPIITFWGKEGSLASCGYSPLGPRVGCG
ncbi:hypothetical protein MRX96_016786 [Rhipicephalus microplus]